MRRFFYIGTKTGTAKFQNLEEVGEDADECGKDDDDGEVHLQ
jgi:hypothetical protein